MFSKRVEAFPWAALDRVTWRLEAQVAATRRWLELAVDTRRLASAFSDLLGSPVELFVRSVDARDPSPSLLRVGLVLATGPGCVIGLEPALAGALLGLLLRQPAPLLDPRAPLSASVAGALSALCVEAARRSGAPAALLPREAKLVEDAAVVHVTMIVGGRPYVAAVWLGSERLLAPAPSDGPLLGALGAIELTLPIVVATNLASAAQLAELKPGAAWCPGAGWWLGSNLQGTAVLVAPTSEHGLRVALGPDARIVLLEPASVALAATEAMAMESDEPSEPATLMKAVLDAPLVVRVELGSISMAAREWAALKPGDVVGTGRRIAAPVLLRAGGRVLATGELVNIEGELGVRIGEIVPEART